MIAQFRSVIKDFFSFFQDLTEIICKQRGQPLKTGCPLLFLFYCSTVKPLGIKPKFLIISSIFVWSRGSLERTVAIFCSKLTVATQLPNSAKALSTREEQWPQLMPLMTMMVL